MNILRTHHVAVICSDYERSKDFYVRTLGLKVVAEGVETEDQLRLLSRMGARYAQGYYLGRPAPADQLSTNTATVRAGTVNVPEDLS